MVLLLFRKCRKRGDVIFCLWECVRCVGGQAWNANPRTPLINSRLNLNTNKEVA